MPTRIPIYKQEIFERLDKDKAEIIKEFKHEIYESTVAILAKIDRLAPKEVVKLEEVKQPIIINKKKK